MTIGVDIRSLSGKNHSGVEEYTLNILTHLIKSAPEAYFKLFSNSFKKQPDKYQWNNNPNARLYNFKIPNRIFSSVSRILNIPKIDKMLGGCDVFFSPHFHIAPVSKKCKKVITFHDLSFVRYPEFFSLKQNIWHKTQMNPQKQAQEADKIIAVSESTKTDLIELFGINENKIKVIYSGIDDKFFETERDDINIAVKNKYHLPSNYVLFLGTLEPRKNIVGIIKAFELLSRIGEFQDFHLVLAGNIGWRSEEVFDAIKKSSCRSRIIVTGSVESFERRAIYQNAKLFVYPSFFEGFGFPPLEAMASGMPVITSNGSSLPEVVGDAALLIDPYNVEEIFGTMKLLLLDEELCQSYVLKGKERAKKFSWTKSAEETLGVLVS